MGMRFPTIQRFGWNSKNLRNGQSRCFSNRPGSGTPEVPDGSRGGHPATLGSVLRDSTQAEWATPSELLAVFSRAGSVGSRWVCGTPDSCRFPRLWTRSKLTACDDEQGLSNGQMQSSKAHLRATPYRPDIRLDEKRKGAQTKFLPQRALAQNSERNYIDEIGDEYEVGELCAVEPRGGSERPVSPVKA